MILICVIAKKLDDLVNIENVGDVFSFEGEKYEKLLCFREFGRLLVLEKECGFYLVICEFTGVEYLAIFYSPYVTLDGMAQYHKIQRTFIISSFFENVDKKSDALETDVTTETFYEKLKQAHENDDLSSITENVQHKNLKVTTKLRPYQKRAIRWMLKRELEVDFIMPEDFECVRSIFQPEQIYYYNAKTLEFVSEKPKCFEIPRGGLLADEMGLGKTVEMITLMLMNPRKKGVKRKAEEVSKELVPLKEMKRLKPKDHIIQCLCNKEMKSANLKNMIICSNCNKAQHLNCVFKRAVTEEEKCTYVCPLCWKSSNKIVEVKTTIIVAPASIKNQWKSEINRHVQDENFKVLLYNGISSGWISPDELGTYDCVITDFNTLSRELYFTKTFDRRLRQRKKYQNPKSPLVLTKWWRVILDEAQMVENCNARPSQMVAQLPAQLLWSSTGTPIERGSIVNLQGIMSFLRVDPVVEKLQIGIRKFQFDQNFINMISKVMWRTCKKDVEHEIEIPPQKEIIHYVTMSELQKCFYTQVHYETKQEFFKRVQRFQKNLLLFGRDKSTIKSLLEPLRKIRQDCTIANLFINVNEQTRVKQTLRADQLHEHLVSKTSIECKSALRTICTSLNGTAAIKIAESKYQEAIGLYKQVIRLAKDYTGVVSVDSMLQIHSYFNLIEVASIALDETELNNKELYRAEMSKLEWKYISNYYEKVTEINDELRELKPEISKAMREYTDRNGIWWKDIISIHRTGEEDGRFIDLINSELFTIHPSTSALFSEVRTTYGIEMILTSWSDNVEKYTKEIKKRFDNIAFLTENLRPSNELSKETNEKIEKLARDALSCHLNLYETGEKKQQGKPKNPKELCEMCELKKKLDEYECVLFNKTLVDDVMEGTWSPRMEERLLKAIFNYAKRSDFEDEIIDTGKKFFTYLEALKKKYKLLAKLWVEANYTISAYDEMNMCKIRMEVVDSADQITKEDARYRLKITKYEIEQQLEIFKLQKQDAEIQFTRLNGRLKYLNHLKGKNDDICPICTNPSQTKERYYVFICGHSVCAECFIILTKDKRSSSKINCPVCRTQQEMSSVYAVSTEPTTSSNEIQINGCFSPKIDEIIRCILKLKKEEPDVKIIIFSQWDTILSAIQFALRENDITFKSPLNVSSFCKQIEEFKDYSKKITCLMLNLKFGGKGLNLTEATHVFLVEPILNADEELQAINRIHRIGQTRKTFVHKFITKETIENVIYEKIISEKDKWNSKKITIKDLEDLFPEGCGEDENFPISLF